MRRAPKGTRQLPSWQWRQQEARAPVTLPPGPCRRPLAPPLLPQLQLKLTLNVALMSGLHLISPVPGKEGPAGLEKDHTWQLLIETRPPVTGFSSFLLKRLLITNKLVFVFRV